MWNSTPISNPYLKSIAPTPSSNLDPYTQLQPFIPNPNLGAGDIAKISYHDLFYIYISRFRDFITILCHVDFTILS